MYPLIGGAGSSSVRSLLTGTGPLKAVGCGTRAPRQAVPLTEVPHRTVPLVDSREVEALLVPGESEFQNP